MNFVQFVTGQNLWDPSIRYLTELPSKTDPVEIVVIASMALVFFPRHALPRLEGGEHGPGSGAAL